MPKDDSNLNAILDELKSELSDDAAKEAAKDYAGKLKKYDTNLLLNEVYDKLNVSQEIPSVKNDSLSSQPPSGIAGETVVAEAVDAPAPIEKQPDESERNLATSQEIQEKAKPASESLSHSTHLKYMALKKNREKVIQNFTLNEQLKAPKTEIIPDQVMAAGTTEPSASHEQSISNQEPEHDDTSPIKAYIPGQTPTEDVPVVHTAETPDELQQLTPKHILEWGKPVEQQMDAQSLSGRGAEYMVPAQKETARSSILQMKRTLTIKSIILLILMVFSGIIYFLNNREVVNPIPLLDPLKNPVSYCGVQLVIMLIADVVCFDLIRDGFTHIFHLKPGRYCLYTLSAVAMLLFNSALFVSPESINSLDVQLYLPVLLVVFLLALLGKQMALDRIQKNFDFVSGDGQRFASTIMENQEIAEDFTKGAVNDYPNLVYNKKTPFLSDFFNESFSEDMSDRISKYTTPIIAGASVLLAIVALIMGYDIFSALTVLTGVLLAGTGSINLFFVNYPLFRASKLSEQYENAVLGYNAVDNFSDVNSAVLSSNQLFLPEQVVLYRIIALVDVAHVIQDAASVLCETKSILGDVFLNICDGKKEYLDTVDTVIYEDGMGISAWLGNRRVLIGSREMMVNHNIRVPSEKYEQQLREQNKNLIYFSTGGELGAIFVIGITPSDAIRNMLVDLYNNDIVCIVKAVDPFLTAAELGRVYNIPETAFRVIPSRLYKETESMFETKENANGAVCNNGTLSSYLYSFLLAKRLNKPIQWGVLVNFVSIGVAVLLFAIFTLLTSLNQMTNFVLCCYEIISLLVSLIIQKCYRLTDG